MRTALKVSAISIVAWSIIFNAGGTLNASSIIMSYYTRDNVVDTSLYFGSSEMSILTETVLDSGKNQVTFVQSFDNLSQMLEHDALWLQRRDRTASVYSDYSGNLTSIEISNIQAFIATGRRVVIFGEWGSWPYDSSLGWTNWDNQILGMVGGSYDSAYGDEPVAVNPEKSLEHPLTTGVTALSLLGNRYGAALGGASLFQPSIANLWDDNVLTILDTGVFLNVRWDMGDNGVFGTNVAKWITSIDPLLGITKQGTGTGDVFSIPLGISCGSVCNSPFIMSTDVTLTAEADTGSHFDGWSGCNFSYANLCFLTMVRDKSVTATFSLNTYTLTATMIGSGSGILSALGLSCISDSCTGNYLYNTPVTITATPATYSTFSFWTGCDSASSNTCIVTMTDNRSVSAAFTLKTYALTVGKSGTGTGTVTALGINCGTDCGENYIYGTGVTLTASANTGSTFAGWTDCDSVSSNDCSVTMTSNKTVSAAFTLNTYPLTATKSGTGSGSLMATGLSCINNTCTGTYNYNETVHITATADTGSVFGSWSGCDSVNGNVCTILINGDKSITATFYLEYTLLVHLEGTGDGRVVSSPSGIDCEPTCSDTFLVGTPITLTAYPYGGSAFAYWSGACSGASTTCEVIMSGFNEVFAHFVSDDTNEYKLKVKKSKKNGGDGTITSSDGYLDCGDICFHTYYKDTVVTLLAVANDTSTFLGWKPDKLNCIGTGSCTVTMDKAKSVQAVFVGDYRLKVVNQSKKGGTGIVTSNPSGISCQTGNATGCQATYPYAEQVTLSASADGGSTFLGWNPAKLCPGSGTCTVPMDKKRTIKAVFSGQ